MPEVRLYAPWGVAVWLLTELMADGDTVFGLCDLRLCQLGSNCWTSMSIEL